MRPRDRILANLESAYREAFDAAKERGDQAEMGRLDFEYQRDQIHLEVLLDVRSLLAARERSAEEPAVTPKAEAPKKERSLLEEGTALLEKAEALKRITRLR